MIPSLPWPTVNFILRGNTGTVRQLSAYFTEQPFICKVCYTTVSVLLTTERMFQLSLLLTCPGWCWCCLFCRHRSQSWSRSRSRGRSAEPHHPGEKPSDRHTVKTHFLFTFVRSRMASGSLINDSFMSSVQPSVCCRRWARAAQTSRRWASWPRYLQENDSFDWVVSPMPPAPCPHRWKQPLTSDLWGLRSQCAAWVWPPPQ